MTDSALPKGLLRELREQVQAWCKREGLSREDAASAIVQQHYGAGFDARSGIVFEELYRRAAPEASAQRLPPTERALRTAADRIFRWLDDETKDKNLLPASFLPSMLLALPEEDSLNVVNSILAPIGMEAFTRLPQRRTSESDLKPAELLRDLVLRTGDAEKALAEMLDGIDPGELGAARKELRELFDVTRQVLGKIEACI